MIIFHEYPASVPEDITISTFGSLLLSKASAQNNVQQICAHGEAAGISLAYSLISEGIETHGDDIPGAVAYMGERVLADASTILGTHYTDFERNFLDAANDAVELELQGVKT